MKLKLRLVSGSEVDDVVVTADAGATVGQLAEKLRLAHPRVRSAVSSDPSLSLRVQAPNGQGRVLEPTVGLGDAGIRSGDVVALTNGTQGVTATSSAAATLRVVAGPDAGKSFPLPVGTSLLGRDRACAVRLGDPLVSKRHARINVSDVVEIIDDNSANGMTVGGELVQRIVVRSTDEITIGDTVFSVTNHVAAGAASSVVGSAAVEFNRSPRLDPTYAGVELVAPEPPPRAQPHRFPIITLVAPLLMGAVMYAVTKNALSLIFVALSPVMALGSYFEGRLTGRKTTQQTTAQFRASLRDLAVQLQYAIEIERTQRGQEHPAVHEVFDGALRATPLLWTRRPEHESFGQFRLGLGRMPSRNSVKLPTTNNTMPELWRELHDLTAQFGTVDRVPVVASLREAGGVGVGGPSAAVHGIAAGLLAQVVGLHSPAEVAVAAVTTTAGAARWEWLKWLPHTSPEALGLGVDLLASSSSSAVALVSALEELIGTRLASRARDEAPPLPMVVLLVEEDAVFDRSRLVQIAERGPAAGVHPIWLASSLERVPAACRAFVELDPNSGVGRAGFVTGGAEVHPLEVEGLTPEQEVELGRALAPVVDAGAPVEDQSDLPRSVSFLTLGGLELADSAEEVIERWRASNSLPPAAGAPRLKRDNTLRALVGAGSSERLYLDLRTQGPHALVGGTTGAGKSEFLQSWILGLAAAHSPTRVNFLFVDYKGGAAFADCVQLPHCVGLVTDLSPFLVRRALRSLNAELRRREHILNRKKAKDLLELERRPDPEAPPSLVIVVDEFAALVTEVPEFVDGVVNVAQRGRSLGLHLVLATQRPSGVIKDNLRANTNLRVALRMADEDDSTDVIGTPLAGSFDPAIPGRAVAKTGPGRLTVFQSAYVGGHTSATPPPPDIDVQELRFGPGQRWEAPVAASAAAEEDPGPNDIRRIVGNIVRAASFVGLPAARKPWLPELAPAYRLEDLPAPRNDTELVFGVIDRPDDQAQPTVAFQPDRVGNMAVYGTGGSGKSTFLRSIAVAAAFSPARGGPCHVYALDFGTRGLAMLADLPHVGAVINGDDSERVARVLKMIRLTIDERAERYAKVNAASIQEYRETTGQRDEPRILLLVDNFGAFRQAYEISPQSWVFEMLESIAADGRAVGVNIVASADQANTFTAGMNSVIQSHLALRLTADMDFTVLGVPFDAFSEATPAGRGFLDGSEVQVAVIGGDANYGKQATAVSKLAGAMRRAGVVPAPGVARLDDRIVASELRVGAGGAPLLGVWDETLEPIAFDPHGVFVVSGPPQSGRTTTVASMVQMLRRVRPGAPMVLFGSRRSPLGSLGPWRNHAATPDEVCKVANELAKLIADEAPEVADLVVVIENVGEYANSIGEDEITELLKACRNGGQFVIAEGETSTMSVNFGFMGLVKLNKYGIAMQPDQMDGDMVFGTDFPRVARAEFPVGRGLHVRAGRVYRVQVALP